MQEFCWDARPIFLFPFSIPNCFSSFLQFLGSGAKGVYFGSGKKKRDRWD
jgi:hypothetical protein